MSAHTTPHVLPKSTYYAVYAALMVLLVATVGFAFIDLGSFNFPVTMAIAVAKALMIALIFMHVYYSERLVWVFAGASFLWLGIMITYTLNDYFTRGMLGILGK
ncbi:cytochrome c oxidase subunit 4 [Singulisphaera sp. GP187]|uniref:cytochrome C oxidase subunit IV family protein n=1 Tax=Singulisphaera sp. GP187 TaxID=1882752 RepID=UPI000928CCA8|nr:cytochrome C oxidase subunit IV family protein [Singulisphaera sp. GP187]SIO57008.1 cytochrome c oxidase subunit 4 [Singulisphaera sp. GP187]